MHSLDEWCFEFDVTASEPIPRSVADDLLCVEAIGWAEDRKLGIGGGYRPASPEVGGAALTWRYQFGLCVQADGLTIPVPQAAELRRLLSEWCESHGLSFLGGFRPFGPAE